MNKGVFIWIVIFAVSAASFFLIAAVVAIKGFFDLRLLLRNSNRKDKFDAKSNATEENLLD